MRREPGGWFWLTTAQAASGTRYRYRVDGVPFPDPAEPAQPDHAFWLARYHALVDIRRRAIAPRLAGLPPFAGRWQVLGPKAVIVEWRLGDGSRLVLAANFSAEGVPISAETQRVRMLYASAAPGSPLSTAVYLSQRDPR